MISIITSLYKSDKHIHTYEKNLILCAKDLIANNIPFEVIAISNDTTPEEKITCSRLALNPWFTHVEVPRETLYATWNRGISVAEGSMCTFWNVDDIRFSKALVDGYAKIHSGSNLVYFPFTYKRYIRVFGHSLLVKKITVTPPLFTREEFTKSMHCGPFFMFSKKLFDSVGPFDASYKIIGDYEWCVRAAEKCTFDRSDSNAGIFTNDGTTLSGSKDSMHTKEIDRMKAKRKT